jgi:Ca-activated chloride channel homolog
MFFRGHGAVLLLLAATLSMTRSGLAADSPIEVRKFPVAAGDTLLVQLDYGVVRVHGRNAAQLEAHLSKHAKDTAGLENVELIAQKQADKIYLQSYFYDYQGQSVTVDIWAPFSLNVIIQGANPQVQISDLEGYVRVHSLTGSVVARNLTGSTSLMTDTGSILFRSQRQFSHDLRLESVSGRIVCELHDELNFRAWARAGGQLKWNDEVQMDQGTIERQIGLGGPLCYASSLRGPIEFQVLKELPEASQASPPDPSPSSVMTPPSPVVQPPVSTPAATQPATPAASTARPEPPPSGAPEGQSATQEPPGTYDTGYKLKVEVDWIYLNASVRDRRSNRSIPNLHREDFLLYEDGVQQTIGKFQETQEPFYLLLLLDTSGSTEQFQDMIKQASIQFTREIGSADRIALATFNSRFRMRQDFTSDRNAVVDAIRGIRSGGGTAFYDALHESVSKHLRRIEGRKAVVVFSDGVDNQLQGNPGDGSTTTFEELYREVQAADALIYTIFLDTEENRLRAPGRNGTVIDILEDIMRGRRRPTYPRRQPSSDKDAYQEAKRQMELIADQTGGRMYVPARIEDLAHSYSEIADDLRVQYTLGYNSTNPSKDATYRQVKVSIANRSDLVVRTRKGYYSGAGVAENEIPSYAVD